MTDRYFVLNLETEKLNIYTGGKSDWLSLPESDREEIKRGCLWSKSINGWVSRGKDGSWNTIHLKDKLKALGFEDRGTEGEKLSFAEQVETQQARAAARADRMEDRAHDANAEATRLYNQAHTMAEAIPFGQPILVGHHSETRDRNYRERIHNTFGRAFGEMDKAKHYESRAATARATAEGAQFSNPRYLGNRIKECESELRQIGWRMEGKFYSYSEPGSFTVTDEHRATLEERKAEIEDKLGFFQHCLATCGKVLYTRETLKGKEQVKIRGCWERVVRLNPTTVSVYNLCFPTEDSQRKWPLKYNYTDVQDAR